ncbi:MAG: ABC transporter permease subunit, partial [Schaedlerella sp.]
MSAKQNQRTPNRTHLRRADGLSLIRFEFLKIVRKRSTLTIMAVSLLLTAFLFGLPVIQYQIYDQNGVMKGTKGIAYDREQYADLSVPLTEEYITKTIREVQELFEVPANVGFDGNERFLIGDVYWNGIAPRQNFLNLIAKTYASPNESKGYNSFPDLDALDGADFYQAIQAKREAILNAPGSTLSNEQKAYWSGMAGKIDTPLQYGYYEGWEVIISSFGLLLFAVLAICIVIAPVFSGEYQAGTDAVILSAKYGRTKLITAKLAASLLFGTIAFAFHMVIACTIPLAAFGVSGWNLPMQIANTAIPYPLTFLRGTMLNIGIIYLVLLGMIGLTHPA